MMTDKPSVFEVTFMNGDAEACMLITAHTRKEAIHASKERIMSGNVCWEGEPGPSIDTRISSVVELGADGQ